MAANVSVTAQGADLLGLGHACVGYLSLAFGDGLLAHCYLIEAIRSVGMRSVFES